MSRLVIASNNPGKLREFDALLAPLGFDPVAQRDLGIDEADEPHSTFVENALAKARHASAASGLAALADDSGLCVAALGGRPGVRSARYADGEFAIDSDTTRRGSAHEATRESTHEATREAQDRLNNAKLIAALAGHAMRDAYYLCVLVFMRSADDPEPVIAVGRWAGTIVSTPAGSGGFGYDPHFLVNGLGRTAAELDRAITNRSSHRAIAMRSLASELVARGIVGMRPVASAP